MDNRMEQAAGETSPLLVADMSSQPEHSVPKARWWQRVAYMVCGVILVVIGILIGYYTAFKLHSCNGHHNEDISISSQLMNSISAINIEDNLRNLTAAPHLAGTPEVTTSAEYVQKRWLEQGLDSAKLVSYNVLLSYPDANIPNKVSILENGDEIFHSALEEKILRPEDYNPNIVPPFSAFSAKGDIVGDLVFVNYGRYNDFNYIKDSHPDINLNESIVIIKDGVITRHDKVYNAQDAGAKAVILYSDPGDYAPEGVSNVYPSSWWLPGTGVQRGNIFKTDAKGDSLTPGYPSKPYMYRLKEEDTTLPRVPVHPIGYDDARRLLSEMSGPKVPDEWIGSLNITYRIGPGFVNANKTVRVSVHSNNEQRTINNVIGCIRGEIEPDRYVILGNHRDAWVYGGIDPSSGTALLLEISRAYGELVKSGRWRPRRTVIFASWDAEEYGLVGSTEYVEEYQNILGERLVAYINVDLALPGNYTFLARGSPLMYQSVYEATKKIPDPDDVTLSLYDSWLALSPPGSERPTVYDLGSGSDFAPFIYRIGVPSLDMFYAPDPRLQKTGFYPLYHSAYDTFYCVKAFYDPTFAKSQAMARVWAEVSRDMADSVILPMNSVDYANRLIEAVNGVRDLFEKRLKQEDIYFDDIISATENFTSAANSFQLEIDQVNTRNALDVRRVNDKLMKLERSFIDPLGLPDRKLLRHVIFAPSRSNSFASSTFPGLTDAIFEIDSDPNPEVRWDVVKEQMAIIAFIIQSAANGLADVVGIL